MNSTKKTVCLLYSSISLSKATKLIEEMPIGAAHEHRCDPIATQTFNILNNGPNHGVSESEIFDRSNCNWALPHDTNPCE
jgi:hypothetical protein